MMRGRFPITLLAPMVAVAMMLPTTVSDAAMSEDQVRTAIEREFGVEVLRVSPGTADGRAVFMVTVMNPPGDFNEAFQVNTLVVDAETGRLVPQFRHNPSGHTFSGSLWNTPNRRHPDASRGSTWR